MLAPQFNLAVGPTSLKYLLYVLAFGLLAYGLLVAGSQAQSTPRSLALGVSLFAVAAILSSALGTDPAGSVGRLVMIFAAVALFLAVLVTCRTPSQLVTVAAGAVGGLLVAGAHGLSQHLLGVSSRYTIVSGGDVLERVQGSFGHPNELGGYIAVVLPLALAFALGPRFRGHLRLLAVAAVLVAVPALFFTYSRGPALALAAGLVAWLAVIRPRLALPAAAAVAAGAVLLVPAALEERFEERAGGSVAIRSDIWKAALHIYAEHPVTGVGLNNFPDAYAALPTALPGGGQRRLLHTNEVLIPPYAENVYLNVLAEEGIVGLTALAVFLAAALLTAYRGARVSDPVGRTVCLGIGAGLVTLVFHGVVQVTLFTETMLVVFPLLAVAARFVTLDWERAREATGTA